LIAPQAKGKVEREHQFWQGRLPPYLASEKIDELQVANPRIDSLRAHRNAHEIHRELRQTPQRAWNQAKKKPLPWRVQRRAALGGTTCGAYARR